MNNKLTIETNNIFDDAKQAFEKTAECDRLRERYRLKSYNESRKPLKNAVLVLSFVLNAISIATASTFVVWLLNLPFLAGLGLAVFMLILLEGLKRYSIPLTFKEYFQFKSYSITGIVGVLALFTASAGMSYYGGKMAIKKLSAPPELVNIQNIQADYSKRAEIFTANIERAEKMTWKGRIVSKGQAIIKDAQGSLAALEISKTKAIENAQILNQSKLSTHDTKTSSKAWIGALIALLADISLLGCFWFIEYYNFRSISEFADVKTTRFVASDPIPPTNIPINPEPILQPISATDTRPRNIQHIFKPENSEYSVHEGTIKVPGFKERFTLSQVKGKITSYKWKLEQGTGKASTNKDRIIKFEKALNILNK